MNPLAKVRHSAGPALAAAALLAAMPAPAAHAADRDCPDSTAIQAALAVLLPDEPKLHTASAFVVLDHGGRYEISVAGVRRTYVDPQRDCAERARVAAIFVALTLRPPQIEAPPVEAPAPPVVQLRKENRTAFELAGTGEAAEDAPATWGATAGVSWGSDRWAALAALGVRNPATLTFAGAQVRMLRVPLDLALRVRGGATWRWAVDGGLSLALLRLSDGGLVQGGDRTRIDPGVLLAARVERMIGGSTSVFVALTGRVHLRPYRLLVQPTGVIGETPDLWLGAAVGAAWSSR